MPARRDDVADLRQAMADLAFHLAGAKEARKRRDAIASRQRMRRHRAKKAKG